jgi:plastocyanin
MKAKNLRKHFWLPALYSLAGWMVAWPLSGQAAVTNVTIQDFFFNPADVTINVNDQILWTWADIDLHSSTSGANLTPDGLWDSGLMAQQGFTFSLTFTNAGSFPYFCSYHLFTGSVTVQGASVPPSVAITAPTNGAVFAAPWTGTIQATVSVTGATVSKVDFLAGATPLGTVTNPPANPSFTVTNLPAGSYTLTAVATDSMGATKTSAGVGITVVTPGAIVLSSPKRLSASAFQFSYSATPGLGYVVLRSGALPNLAPISTNTATSNTVSFLDNNATGPANFYRVRLVPNP